MDLLGLFSHNKAGISYYIKLYRVTISCHQVMLYHSHTHTVRGRGPHYYQIRREHREKITFPDYITGEEDLHEHQKDGSGCNFKTQSWMHIYTTL